MSYFFNVTSWSELVDWVDFMVFNYGLRMKIKLYREQEVSKSGNDWVRTGLS